MNADDLRTFLRKSLADGKFTPSEKKALTEWLAEHVTNEQELGVARHIAFEVANAAIPTEHAGVVGWLEDVMRVIAPMATAPVVKQERTAGSPQDVGAFFSPGERCLQQIVHRFMTARRTADVCVYTITDDRISRSILDAHRRGVKIRIISDHDKSFDPGSDIQKFREDGIAVKLDDIHKHSDRGRGQDGHMHHKFAIFDGVRLLNGSYNWTRGAADTNYENIVDTDEAKLVAAFVAEFERLWKRF